MSLSVAAAILVMASAAALLLAFPLIYVLRKIRKKSNPQRSTPRSGLFDWLLVFPGLLLGVGMYFVFATEYTAPESWLGRITATAEGQLSLFVVVPLVLYAIHRFVTSLFRRSSRNRGTK